MSDDDENIINFPNISGPAPTSITANGVDTDIESMDEGARHLAEMFMWYNPETERHEIGALAVQLNDMLADLVRAGTPKEVRFNYRGMQICGSEYPLYREPEIEPIVSADGFTRETPLLEQACIFALTHRLFAETVSRELHSIKSADLSDEARGAALRLAHGRLQTISQTTQTLLHMIEELQETTEE